MSVRPYLIMAGIIGTVVVAHFALSLVPSPIEELRRENRHLRGDIQTAIHVVGFMRDDIQEMRSRLAALEATRPNTQTEQDRP